MSIKILTQNSIQVTNIDGARENNFTAGNRSGIVKGAFNEGNFFSASSNVIALDSCELLISGHRVVIDSAESITLTNRPSTNTRYSLVAEIVVNDASTPSFRLFVQSINTQLKQDNLYKTTTGSGTYQVEIGRFTLTTSGTITDVVRTIDVITGGKGNDDTGAINIGTIKTNTLDSGMEAEVDVEQRFDSITNKTLTDFSFSLPRGLDGQKGDKGDTALTFAVGSVTNGETVSVTNSGTDTDIVLDFVLQKGEKGDKGEEGLIFIDYPFKTTYNGQTTLVPLSKFPEGFDFYKGTDQPLLSNNGVIAEYASINYGGEPEVAVRWIFNLKGEKGDTALTLSVGSVTSGEVASVTNVGTDTDLVFDFVLPKGEKGDAGVRFEYDEETKTLNIITE